MCCIGSSHHFGLGFWRTPPRPSLETQLSPTSSQIKFQTSLGSPPPELKLRLLRHLLVAEMKQARLWNSTWAKAAAREIFQICFSTRLDPNDKQRFLNIAQRLRIAAGIKHLEIFAGNIGMMMLRDTAKSTKNKLAEVSATTRLTRALRSREGALKSENRKRKELLGYLDRHLGNYLNLMGLSQVLSCLHSFKSLAVSSVEHPFSRTGVISKTAGMI